MLEIPVLLVAIVAVAWAMIAGWYRMIGQVQEKEHILNKMHPPIG